MGVLGRIREADAEPVAQAIVASFDHLRPWMPWATDDATHLDAQRTFCRESQTQWDEGSDYIWLLRPHGTDAVAGSFGLHRRVGPGAIEVCYWSMATMCAVVMQLPVLTHSRRQQCNSVMLSGF